MVTKCQQSTKGKEVRFSLGAFTWRGAEGMCPENALGVTDPEVDIISIIINS